MPEPSSQVEAAAPAAPSGEGEILKGSSQYENVAAMQARNAPAPPVAQNRERSSVAVSVESLLISIVIALFLISFMVQAFEIPTESMQNTLLIGDYLLVDKVHFGPRGGWPELMPYTAPQRGDVVVFHFPLNPSQYFVKRVIGVPGDRVRMVNKQVWVNERRFDDGDHAIYGGGNIFRDAFPSAGFGPVGANRQWLQQMPRLMRNGELVVPAGSYFVLGDNRDDSDDSRYWGFVPAVNIVGRPLVIYFSLGRGRGRAAAGDGKLAGFAATLTDVWRHVRWQRMLSLVN